MADREMADWVGRTQVETDEASASILRRVAALLDMSPKQQDFGGVVPQGWHLTFFPALAPQSQLSEDGHPAKGAFLPPIPFPRRLFAGRRIEFCSDIPFGAELVRTSTITRISPKQGKQGPMTIVEVEHVITANRVRAVRETHTIIYRPAAAATGSKSEEEARHDGTPRPAELSEQLDATTALLFRYSAITFNAHRIHYDHPYATHVEGYPGLVVNGGLIALKLCELAKRYLQGVRLSAFEIRHIRPFYAGNSGQIHCCRAPQGHVDLWALDEDGHVTAEGKVHVIDGILVK